MKTKLQLSIFLFVMFVQSSITVGQGNFFPSPNYDMGNIGRGWNVSEDLTFIQTFEATQAYTVEIFNNAAPWLSISPASFSLSGFGAIQTINLSGQVPMDLPFGYNSFFVIAHNADGGHDDATVDYTCSTVGIDDYITIGDYTSSFSVGDPVHCHADFHNNPPYYDAMSSWNLKMEIYPFNGPTFTYESIDKTGAPTMHADWDFNANQLPNNGPFIRNEFGQVTGKLTVSGIDEGGYSHYDVRWFGINKEPDQPILFYGLMDGNSIILSYTSYGASNYSIYYATHNGPPYDGTGASQGPSPIFAGNSTNFEISGLQQCTPYYFAVKGTNNYGTSVYSNESRIILFTAQNQLPVEYFLNDVNINNNFTYNTNHYFAKNLIIEPGSTLNVNNCFLYFDVNSKVVIKPGGKLILNGATCTSPCGQTWKGIEVWGNYNQNQYTINGQCAQGKLELTNGAIIENADNAIALWHPGDYYSSGGIVTATNATFKNNKRDAEFIAYTNHHPINGQITNYISSFSNCHFITDDNYINPSPFYSFITMWGVDGIRIEGCNFQNLKPLSTNSNRGYGIYSNNASYFIRSTCSCNITPCPSNSCLVHTIFQGLFAGVAALNSGTYIKSISVIDAKFIDNGYGVKDDGVSYPIIVNNQFQIGPNNICPNMTGIGVELNNCNGYTIEENTFTYSTSWPAGDNFIGIHVYYDPKIPAVLNNELYKNSFIGLSMAIQADGRNNGNNSNPNDGLHYYCNTNQNNIGDFYSTGIGIAQNQGSSSKPAGNTFSLFSVTPYSDFNDQATWPIIYTYERGRQEQNPKNTYRVFKDSTYTENPCPSHFNGGGNQTSKLTQQQITELEQDFANNSIAYDNVNAIFQALKDGGSSEGTIMAIQTSSGNNTMELRDQLLGESPHLSIEALKAAADRYDVLPDPILFEILAANPDELRNEELLTYLSEKNPPLPDYMIDLLRELAKDSSYKTTLLREMSELNEAKTRDAYAIIRDMLQDSITDMNMVRNWLDNLHNINADYLIIDSWLQENNITSASALIDLLPQTYSFDDSAMVEYYYYKDLKDLQTTLITENKNIFQLDSTQIEMLENIASHSKGIAGTQSQSILAFAYGNLFINCPLPYSNTKISKCNKLESINTIFQPKVNSYPNPSEEWVVFEYSIPSSVNNCSLKIVNLMGQFVEEFKISNNSGMIIWDTRKIKEGNYIYTLNNDKYSTSGKITIIH